MEKLKLKFSVKFYSGVAMIVLSLVVGLITKAAFFLYLTNDLIRNTALIIYLLSWPPLILGVYWVGKEYAEAIKKYFSYQFYQQSLMKGTGIVTEHLKTKTGEVIIKTRNNLNWTKEKTKAVGQRVKERSLALGSRVRHRFDKKKSI